MNSSDISSVPVAANAVLDRGYFLELARRGVRLPISAHITLHQRPDPEAARYDGRELGEVIIETARTLGMPLAFPLMDLKTEKEWLLGQIGVPEAEMDTYHFEEMPEGGSLAKFQRIAEAESTRRMQATLEAITHVRQHSELVAVGMCIGPFSLATKLLKDPITAAFQLGIDPEDEDAELLVRVLEIGTEAICSWVERQVKAGAQAVCVCEPAYNTVYVSPKQMERDESILERLVIGPNRRIREVLRDNGAELIFHDCGELNEPILRSIAQLDPAILSLGSPCDLPRITHLIGKNTVLMGNLPSKKFYSDNEITEEEVVSQGRELLEAMGKTTHPFILGTECDVLCVAGCTETIRRKVMAVTRV